MQNLKNISIKYSNMAFGVLLDQRLILILPLASAVGLTLVCTYMKGPCHLLQPYMMSQKVHVFVKTYRINPEGNWKTCLHGEQIVQLYRDSEKLKQQVPRYCTCWLLLYFTSPPLLPLAGGSKVEVEYIRSFFSIFLLGTNNASLP